MYGDSDRGGAATALRFVTCDLSSLTDCGCMTSTDSDIAGSSTKRKTRSSGSLIDPDSFTALSAKRLILGRPTIIDRLISRNKSALEEMEGKRRGPGRPALSGRNKGDSKDSLKRKRTESMNGTSPAIKRLRSSKGGSESDSSESRNTSVERKRGRPPLNKSPSSEKKSPKKPTRKVERRFSVRIHHSSLRSGKKRKELLALKQKRIKNLSKDPKTKKKWSNQDKTDSNSNVCPENDSNDEVDDSTDSEMSRGTSESSDLTSDIKKVDDKQKSPDEDNKKKRKRRKRDSMWVRKVKKQIKAKVETADLSNSLHSLSKNNVDEEDDDDEDEDEEDISEVLETSDIPILDKESDESLIVDNINKTEPALNNTATEDVAMPKLEKEVDLPCEKEVDFPCEKQVDMACEKKVELPCENKVNLHCEKEVDFPCEKEIDLPSEKDIDLHCEKHVDLHCEKQKALLSEKEVDLNCEKEEDLPSEEIKAVEVVPSECFFSDKKEIELSAEEKIADDSPSEKSLNVDQPSETNVPEALSLSENDIDHLPSEETLNEGVNIHIRESETVENESKELNIPCEKTKEMSETVTEQVDNIEEIISVDQPTVQLIDTEEHIEMALTEKNKLVLIEEHSNSEENSVEQTDHDPKSILEDNIIDDSRKETEIAEVDNKPVDKSLENGVSEKTEISMETLHEVQNDLMDCGIQIKEEPSIDADSTSDVKPSLDDSFTDFSLFLPDNLDLDSSLSDDHDDRTLEEESDHTLPDSTEETKLKVTKTEELESFPPSSESLANVQYPVDSVNETSQSENVVNEHQKSETLDEAVTPIIDENVALNDNQEQKDKKSPEDMISEILEKDKSLVAKYEELTNEQRQMKESVLQALGLKSLTPQQPEEKPKRDGYTGTLKAVIKLNRTGDKKRMVYRRSEDSMGELEYRICSEIPSTDGVPITHLNDIAGIRKNVSKLHHDTDTASTTTGSSLMPVTSNGHTEDHETINNQDESKGQSTGKESNLVIPEKSSSFSIHPGRLCSDVCSYCFGKFGCLDTPCHVAQLKSERQKKILENEPHLTGESCLCDACYRYVDRKANCPSKAGTTGGSSGKNKLRPPTSSQCCVNHCSQPATHTVKKKWLVKLKKTISNKIQSDKLDIDLDKSAAMYYPLCAQHHYWVDHFTVCGICRKRLNRNHLYSLGSETDRLNLMLAEDGIPARLSDKLFLCKLCRYYSNLRLKYADPSSIPSSGRIFYRDYRRKILISLDIPVSDSDDEQLKEDKKKGIKKPSPEVSTSTNGAGTSTKSEESVMSLSNLATLLGDQPEQQARIQVKFGNVNIGRLSNLNIGQGGREERSPYSDVGLQANLEFQGPAVPDGSWERCISTIQFDKRTKKLWQDLQKPYGNQSSFLRHLVMLEKYWRAGYLSLAQGADERAVKYLSGVKNRIKAFEGSTDKPPTTTAPPAAPAASSEKFPLITNTGEIEVTPLKVAQKKIVPPVVIEKKQMTPLDRAKSLVRMIQPSQRYPTPIQRYPVPMYVPYGYPQQQQHHHHHHLHQRPPPLLKIRNKSMPQAYYTALPTVSSSNLKPILPKLPRALTVTQVPQGGPAITLNRSGITIEKQSGSPVMPALPIEKPSISVFREPAPGPP